MHTVNTTSTIRFVIEPSGSPLSQADYDVEVTKPDGTITYVNNGLTGFTAATATAQGVGTYDQLFDMTGQWLFSMHTGVAGASQIVSKVPVYVVKIPPVIESGGSIFRSITVNY